MLKPSHCSAGIFWRIGLSRFDRCVSTIVRWVQLKCGSGPRRRSGAMGFSRGLSAVAAFEERLLLAALSEFVDPHPEIGNGFGEFIVPLSTGNVVITAPLDDAGGKDAGAVYLFDGATGKLISTLTGSRPGDKIGSQGVVALQTGNFVIVSPSWDNGTVTDVGAVTWGHGKRGVSGVVSAKNSLIGSQSGDQIGGGDPTPNYLEIVPAGVTALSNGNYVVRSVYWDNGSSIDAGAVTWGNGKRGIKGAISPKNSLVGSQSHDSVGSNGLTELTHGNYVVNSPNWANGSATNAGAVTWCSGSQGRTGVVGLANSLVGGQKDDRVGYVDLDSQYNIWPQPFTHNGVTALANGNYVVSSPSWSRGSVVDVGAATWGNGKSGLVGIVSPSNSLVGSQSNDRIGDRGATALTNGNYVVCSPRWNNGFTTRAGAVTWGNGATGLTGVVSVANSLFGTSLYDTVGYAGVTALSNGNYVVSSPWWDNGYPVFDAGAATWGNGSTGITGPVSPSNSLIGGRSQVRVGSNGVTALRNGNYVVISPYWTDGSATLQGAVTWGNGHTGTTGVVRAANSLVGSHDYDEIGERGVVALTNGNFVVVSPRWNSARGAVTWGNGQTGTSGVVSSTNSLVGSRGVSPIFVDFDSDQVGLLGVTALSNGNYVVNSAYAGSSSYAGSGAVTWGNGVSGSTGVISEQNSLVGDYFWHVVGSGGVIALNSGNYLVSSPYWGQIYSNHGAVTWGNGKTGTVGRVNEGNSLIGPEPSAGVLQKVIVDPFNDTVIVRFEVQDRRRVFVRAQ